MLLIRLLFGSESLRRREVRKVAPIMSPIERKIMAETAMDLRRDCLLTQPHSASLTTKHKPVPAAFGKNYDGRALFRSTSPQRPEWQPRKFSDFAPKVYRVLGLDIDYGGRPLGPGDYDTLHEMNMAGGAPHGGAAECDFKSGSPRQPRSAKPLTHKCQFLPIDTAEHTVVTTQPVVPGAHGRSFNTSPRNPSPPYRDPGLNEQSDPLARSLVDEVNKSSRLYKAAFQSGVKRLSLPRSMTNEELGPGRYAPRPGMVVRHAESLSPMFKVPTNSKLQRRPRHLTSMLKKEAYGGEWMSTGPRWIPREHPWTSRAAFTYK